MTPKETLEKAYGNIPNETTPMFSFDIVTVRPLKYYWLRFKRFFTR